MRSFFFALLALSCALPVAAQSEQRVCDSKKEVYLLGEYNARWYKAEQALNCAGFKAEPTREKKVCAAYIPHRAVHHLATVDWQARGASVPALCKYVSEPQNKKWYTDNFFR